MAPSIPSYARGQRTVQATMALRSVTASRSGRGGVDRIVDRTVPGNRKFQGLPGTRTRRKPSLEAGKIGRTYGKEKVYGSIP